MPLNENAKKWVDALRAGKYKQGKGMLRYKEDGQDRFCCLGVACDLYQQEVGGLECQSKVFIDSLAYSYDGMSASLPKQVKEWLNLRTTTGGCLHRSLGSMNDSGYSFDQIADVIASEPEGLFNE